MGDWLDILKQVLACAEKGERLPDEIKPDFSFWSITRDLGADCVEVLKTRHEKVADAYWGDLGAAHQLHEEILPGWWWSVGTCRVSDDARVSPEGPDSVLNGVEWSEITDVDLRPPGNPARAWLIAILKAMIAMEEAR